MIKSEWIVSNMAARNLLEVASADVYAGAECMVLSTGSVFRAVRSGTGATMWAGVCTASGEWTPVYSEESNIKTAGADALSTTFADHIRFGDRVEADVYFAGKLNSTTALRTFEMTLPINPGDDLAFELAATSGQVILDGATTPLWTWSDPGEERGVIFSFATAAADATVFYGMVHVVYRVIEA